MDGFDVCSGIVQPSLVDVDTVPAIVKGTGVVIEIGHKRAAVQLPEYSEEHILFCVGFVYGRAFCIGVRYNFKAVVYYRGRRSRDDGRRFQLRQFLDLNSAPVAFRADRCSVGFVLGPHDVVDDGSGNDRRGHPFMVQRVHGGLDVHGPYPFHQRNIGVNRHKVCDAEYSQKDQQGVSDGVEHRMTAPALLFLLGRFRIRLHILIQFLILIRIVIPWIGIFRGLHVCLKYACSKIHGRFRRFRRNLGLLVRHIREIRLCGVFLLRKRVVPFVIGFRFLRLLCRFFVRCRCFRLRRLVAPNVPNQIGNDRVSGQRLIIAMFKNLLGIIQFLIRIFESHRLSSLFVTICY